MRQRTQEIIKDSNGTIMVVTWEWNNGFNLVDTRTANQAEADMFHANNNQPVTLPSATCVSCMFSNGTYRSVPLAFESVTMQCLVCGRIAK